MARGEDRPAAFVTDIERQLDQLDLHTRRIDSKTIDILRSEGFAANTVRKIGKRAMNLEVAVEVADLIDQLALRFDIRSRAAAIELAVRFTMRAIARVEMTEEKRQKRAACATSAS